MLLSILSGRQKGIDSPLALDVHYLLGASSDDDFILRDAGAARAMLRLERRDSKVLATVTVLAGSVSLGEQYLPVGASLVVELPASLVLQDLSLGIADTVQDGAQENATPAESKRESKPAPEPGLGGVALKPRPLERPKGGLGMGGALLALVMLSVGLSVYSEDLVRLYMKDVAVSSDSALSEFKQRWSKTADVRLAWGTVDAKGKVSLKAFVPDTIVESRLRNDIRKSGLALELRVINLQEVTKRIEGEVNATGAKIFIGRDGVNRLSLQMESDQWNLVRHKITNASFLKDGVAEVGVTIVDAWDHQTRLPLFLRFSKEGAMDEGTRHAMQNLETVLFPDALRKNLSAVELHPSPALVTRQKQRFALGAILANGAELISVDDGWVVISKHGIIRKHKII
jgi:hypothetical protein